MVIAGPDCVPSLSHSITDQTPLGRLHSLCGKGCQVKPQSVLLQAAIGSKPPLAQLLCQLTALLASCVPAHGPMTQHLPVMPCTQTCFSGQVFLLPT